MKGGRASESRQELGEPADAKPPSNDDGVKMKSNLGLIRSTAYVIGTVIGSGIFISPKGVLQNVDLSVPISLIIWAAGGVVALLGSLVYAEFGTRLPQTGGYYIYLKESWGGAVAFVFLWSNLIIVGPSAVAVKCLTFVTYLLQPIRTAVCSDETDSDRAPAFSMPLLGTVLMLLLAYLNSIRSSWGANVQTATTAGKLAGLVLIIVAGVVELGRGKTENLEGDVQDHDYAVGGLVFAFYSAMWAYVGWDAPNYGAAEITNVRRTLPLSLFGGMLLVTVIYMLANLAYLSSLSASEIVSSPAVAFTFAERTLGANFAWLIPVAVCVSLAGSLNSQVFTASRSFMAAAMKGELPEALSLLSIYRRTPVPAIMIFTILGVIMIWILELYALINYLSFALWFEEAFISSGLIYLRVRDWWSERNNESENTSSTTVRFPLVGHIIYFIFSITLTILSFISKLKNSLTGLGILALAIPIYFLFVRYDILSKRMRSVSDWITVKCQLLTASMPYKEE